MLRRRVDPRRIRVLQRAGPYLIYELVVQVTDGQDAAGNPANSVNATINVTIRVTDVNEPPEFDGSSISFENGRKHRGDHEHR